MNLNATFVASLFFALISFHSFAQKKVLITYEKNEETRSYTFYANNETFATHTVELKFPLLENFKTSIEAPYDFVVQPGRTELMSISPIDPKVSTNFKYKKKSRKGCANDIISNDYELPVDEASIEKAFEFENPNERKYTEDQKRHWYAIGFKVPVNETIFAAKDGRVTEIVEVVAPEEIDSEKDKARLYLEIEHLDCSFSKYEFLNDGEFLVEAGTEVIAGQPIGTLGAGDYSPDIPFRFSVYYSHYDMVTVNDAQPYKKYYWAFVQLKFDSKVFEEKFVPSDEVGGTAKKGMITPSYIYIQKKNEAEKKAAEEAVKAEKKKKKK